MRRTLPLPLICLVAACSIVESEKPLISEGSNSVKDGDYAVAAPDCAFDPSKRPTILPECVLLAHVKNGKVMLPAISATAVPLAASDDMQILQIGVPADDGSDRMHSYQYFSVRRCKAGPLITCGPFHVLKIHLRETVAS